MLCTFATCAFIFRIVGSVRHCKFYAWRIKLIWEWDFFYTLFNILMIYSVGTCCFFFSFKESSIHCVPSYYGILGKRSFKSKVTRIAFAGRSPLLFTFSSFLIKSGVSCRYDACLFTRSLIWKSSNLLGFSRNEPLHYSELI